MKSLILLLSVIVLTPVTSTAQRKHGLREDTLKLRALNDSLMQHIRDRENTFKLLPKFHSDKDSAGFQLIPPHVDSYNTVVVPPPASADSAKTPRGADSTKGGRKKR